ncbi:MAG TPA: Spy/CpxP family protein refolding chaperone [Acetobacteraceae bacterium]|nr:Spy/CpxP family protein refolding chaperone [Acetobacteraceae bacterium]
MTDAIRGVARAVAATGLLAALALGAPAANASPGELAHRELAQATPAPGVSSPTPPGGTAATSHPRSPTELVEARIKDLRTKLRITAAQESRFAAVADVMRANARSMQALLGERARHKVTTAVGALRWYERITAAHAAALKRFVPAFEALYTALSNSQRKIADAMFQWLAQRPLPPRSR